MLTAKVAWTAEGGRPVLTYDLSADAFAHSFRFMWSGQWPFPCDLEHTPQMQPNDHEPRGDGARLSSRERDVLLQVTEGHANEAIARRLGTTEATVKVHLTELLRKIRVDNRTQATIWALANLPEAAARVAG